MRALMWRVPSGGGGEERLTGDAGSSPSWCQSNEAHLQKDGAWIILENNKHERKNYAQALW